MDLKIHSDESLFALRLEAQKTLNAIEAEVSRREQEATNRVEVIKLGPKHVIFRHEEFGEFEAKNVAYAGRYRLWRRIPGKNGKMKRGEVLVREALGGIQSLREAIGIDGFKE